MKRGLTNQFVVLDINQIHSTKPLHMPSAQHWHRAIKALQINIEDKNYSFVFEPILVARYGKERKKSYRYVLLDGRKRLLIHRALGLKKIKARIWIP